MEVMGGVVDSVSVEAVVDVGVVVEENTVVSVVAVEVVVV